MLDLLFIPVAILYLLVVGCLFIYGINFFYLIYLAWRTRNEEASVPVLQTWPHVTVQLPVYNEMYVAGRLVEAASRLDYPVELLEIQVLDDSDDETVRLVEEQVAQHRTNGLDIHHIRRQHRTGFKAGALAEGLSLAKGEFLAVFDADFLPPPDFLRRAVPYFQDPGVGFVQARWGHTNPDYSLLTVLQSLAIDAHFMIEQYARSRSGYWFNFNGTAGVWRRQTIESVGGWKADTLTEDLDLSYRAYLKGWRGIYLRDLVAPAELPVNFNAYRRQQHRWARGSLECARKFLPEVWNAPLPLQAKIEATLHLTGYAVHLLLFALVILYPLVLILSQRYASLISLFGIAILFNATAFAPTAFFAVAQHQLGVRWWKRLPAILFVSSLGAGMMANTLRAALQAFGSSPKIFERTPKFGILRKHQDWTAYRYQLKLDPIVLWEIALALVNILTILLAVQAHNWVIAIYAGIFFTGLVFTSGTSILQALAVRHQQKELLSPIRLGSGDEGRMDGK